MIGENFNILGSLGCCSGMQGPPTRRVRVLRSGSITNASSPSTTHRLCSTSNVTV